MPSFFTLNLEFVVDHDHHKHDQGLDTQYQLKNRPPIATVPSIDAANYNSLTIVHLVLLQHKVIRPRECSQIVSIPNFPGGTIMLLSDFYTQNTEQHRSTIPLERDIIPTKNDSDRVTISILSHWIGMYIRF